MFGIILWGNGYDSKRGEVCILSDEFGVTYIFVYIPLFVGSSLGIQRQK
jgi:hypothetical protein